MLPVRGYLQVFSEVDHFRLAVLLLNLHAFRYHLLPLSGHGLAQELGNWELSTLITRIWVLRMREIGENLCVGEVAR